MPAEVREGFREMRLVEINLGSVRPIFGSRERVGYEGGRIRGRELKTYIHKHQPFEVLAGLSEQGAIGAVDASMPVISLWCLDIDTRRRVLCNALLGKALERRKDVCAGFDGVGRAHDIRVRIADVRVRVRIL